MAGRLDTELLITAGVNGLQHIDRLITSIDAAGGDTDQLREAAEKLRNEWDNLSADEQAQRLRDLGNAANQGADDVNILGRNTNDTTSAFDRMSSALKQLAAFIGITFIIGKIKGFFTEAITGAADFEQQLATVQAVSNATVEQMDRIKAASIELGKSTRYNATQAAEGFEILARAGLDTEASLKTIPSVLALAQGNSLELAEASGFVTKAVQGMGLSFDDAGRVADVMAKTAASANTDVQGLGAALSYAAPSAAALGVTIEETAAYIGKFADAGVDASRAGTAFNSILSQFGNDASSFRTELANINITTTDFNEAIKQLAEAGPSGQKAINALGMEAGPAFKALLSQGIDSLDELTAKLNDAQGTAAAQAEIMNNTWQGALAGLDSAWSTLKDTLGESFLGSLTQSFKDLGTEIISLVDSGKVKQFGDSVAAVFTEATTYVIDFIRNVDMSALLDKVSNSLDYLRGISVAANGAFQALSIAANGIKAGFLAIGVAMSMVVTVFAEIIKLVVDGGSSVAKFFGISTEAADKLSAGLGSALAAAEAFRNYGTDGIAKAGESINSSFNSIAGSADNAAIEMISAGDQIADSFGAIVDSAFMGSQETGAAVDEIRAKVAAMIDSFDNPEQFAALIDSIIKTGNEAVVGADLLSRLGAGVADGTAEAKVAVDQVKTAVETLGTSAEEQAEITRQAIDGTFSALNIDVAQQLTGVNSKTQQTFDLIANGAKSVSESTYSATEKAALLSALFAEGLNAAKTKEEFVALNEVTKHYGVASAITAEQQEVLKAGMKGGAAAAREVAAAHKDAAGAVDDQNAALSRLGVSIDAANQKMSKSGYEMVQSLRTGIVAIKEQATSADSLRVALTQALDTSIAAARTQEDFRAIAQVLREAGVAGQVTTVQLEQIEAGMQGGADAARQTKQAIDSVAASAKTIKQPVDDATAALSGMGDQADDAGQRMTKAARDASREFGNLKKTMNDEQGRLLNNDGEVMKVVSYTKESAYDYLLNQLGATESTLSKSDINKLRSKASQMANADGHKHNPFKYGLTNAFQAQEIAAEFVKAYQKAQEKADRKADKAADREAKPQPEPYAPKPYREPSQADILAHQKRVEADKSQTSASTNTNAAEIADAWDERIRQAEERGAERAIAALSKQLIDEAKRRT